MKRPDDVVVFLGADMSLGFGMPIQYRLNLAGLILIALLPLHTSAQVGKLKMHQTTYTYDIPPGYSCRLCNQLIQEPMSGKGRKYCNACLLEAAKISDTVYSGKNADSKLAEALVRQFPENEDILPIYSEFKSGLDDMVSVHRKLRKQSGEPSEVSLTGPEKLKRIFSRDPVMDVNLKTIPLTCQDCDIQIFYKDAVSHSLEHVVKCGCGSFTANPEHSYRTRLQAFKRHRQAGRACQYCQKLLPCSAAGDHEKVCLNRSMGCPVEGCRYKASTKGMLSHIVQFNGEEDHAEISCPHCPESSPGVPALRYPAHFNTEHYQLSRQSECPYCPEDQKWLMSDSELLEHVGTVHPDEYVRLTQFTPEETPEESEGVLFEAMFRAQNRWEVSRFDQRNGYPAGDIIPLTRGQGIEAEVEQMQRDIASLRIRAFHRDKASLKVEAIQKDIAFLKDKATDLELNLQAGLARTYNGVFLWHIPEVKKRVEYAIGNKGSSIYSAPFYTDQNGYKFTIRAYLNGEGAGEGTHLSLFIVLMKGEYDSLLEFPFEDHMVTLQLVDQTEDKKDRKDIVESFRANKGLPSFQRPVNDKNVAAGIPKFCELSKLDDPRYVKDDAMYLKCIIRTPNIEYP